MNRIIVGLALILVSLGARAAPLFTFTDLGNLPGTLSGQPVAINDSGAVAGQSGGTTPTRAWIWQDGVMTDIGTLGGSFAVPSAINNLGLIAGNSALYDAPGGVAGRAFVWDGSQMVDIGVLDGPSASAEGINDSGHVTGWSQVNGKQHAFLWDGTQMMDLGTLFPSNSGSLSVALDVNNSGQVVGYSQPNDNLPSRPFLYQNGVMTELTSPYGGGGYAGAVNNGGVAVGGIGNRGGFWDAGGTFTELAWLDDVYVEPYDINDAGWIIGKAATATLHATVTLWTQPDQVFDLNSLVVNGGDLLLVNALSINNRGQIVGQAFRDGSQINYLLTPIPIPPAVLLFGSALALIGLMRRKISS